MKARQAPRNQAAGVQSAATPRGWTWKSLLRGGVFCLLLLIFFLLGTRAAERASVTFDEFAHIPAGVAYWKERAFHIYPHNPPLARLISTLPILDLALLPAIDPAARSDPEYRWRFAEDFMFRNLRALEQGQDTKGAEPRESAPDFSWYHSLIFKARLPILVLGLLLGTLIFFWSRDLFGYWGGLLSLALYAFCPNMLAHASLATTDLSAALFGALAMLALFRFSRSPCLARLTLAACAFGLALLAKFTTLPLLLPAFVVLLLPSVSQEKGTCRPLRQRALHCILFMVTVWVVFSAGYFFTDMFCALGELPLRSRPFTSLRSLLPDWMPTPLPAAALLGLDSEWLRTEQKRGIFYLLGELSREGWWTYFPIALATKAPIPLLILWPLAFVAGLLRFSRGQDTGSVFTLLVPPVLLMALFLFMTKTNYGIRYLLVCFPFLFVLCGILVQGLRNLWLRVGLILLLAWHVVGSVNISPHYLTYFNELAGGPRGGIRILADSNLDWGQQLKGLKDYMDRRGIQEISLSYTGPIDPRVYGVRWRPLRLGQTKGLAAVSANHLVGYFPMGGSFGGGIQDLSPLLRLKPEAVIAESMYVYELK